MFIAGFGTETRVAGDAVAEERRILRGVRVADHLERVMPGATDSDRHDAGRTLAPGTA